jgi:hypothetical protein
MDEREEIARRLARDHGGFDPNELVRLDHYPKQVFITPEGLVQSFDKHQWRPAWHCYVKVADMIIEARNRG